MVSYHHLARRVERLFALPLEALAPAELRRRAQALHDEATRAE